MTQITIHLERGPDDQPVGQLTTGTGQITRFSGWLHLIRLLEDQLRQAPPQPGADPAADPQLHPRTL
jgi:hypothetical protein